MPPLQQDKSIKLLYFNARSVLYKWDEVISEIRSLNPDVICISECWISNPAGNILFQNKDYIFFINAKPHKKGGGVLLLLNPSLLPRALKCRSEVSNSGAFNITAATIGTCDNKLTTVAAYCPPWAASDDANDKIKVMEQIREENSSYVVMGD